MIELPNISQISLDNNHLSDFSALEVFRNKIGVSFSADNQIVEKTMKRPTATSEDYVHPVDFVIPKGLVNENLPGVSESYYIYTEDNGIFDSETNTIAWENVDSLDKLQYEVNYFTMADISNAPSFSISGDVIVNFADAYKVSYKSTADTVGTIPTDDGEYFEGSKVTVLPSQLTRPGYTFEGWEYGTDVLKAGEKVTVGTTNIEFVAKWEPIPTYTVNYTSTLHTAGTVPTDTDSYLEGAEVEVKASDLERDGYTFAGWEYDNKVLQPGEKVTVGTANIEFVAVWDELPTYHLVYQSENHTSGDVPVDATIYFIGDTMTILQTTIAREGYTFVGWEFAGTTYHEGDNVILTSSMVPKTRGIATDLVLKAQWTKDNEQTEEPKEPVDPKEPKDPKTPETKLPTTGEQSQVFLGSVLSLLGLTIILVSRFRR